MRWGIAAATVVLALIDDAPGVAQPVDLVLTPLPPVATPGIAATPGAAATPHLAATPLGRPADDSGGVGSRLLGQQSAAQATIAAYATREAVQATRIATQEAAQATRIAVLESALAEVQVTATALVVVAANTVLDPTRQSITLETDLGGMLNGDPEAVAEARTELTRLLSRYPSGCRAGFMLISGNAPSIEEGVDLAQRVESLLREGWPAIFTEATGAEVFALPNQPPFGQVSVDIFFYAGCQPTG
ncbi:MAG: hypothetical protein KY456_13455 [Chloroflexi bacterium]|nr:hypothetical protein [Chloroflexota bacterium]